jgi:hypothetical protein
LQLLKIGKRIPDSTHYLKIQKKWELTVPRDNCMLDYMCIRDHLHRFNLNFLDTFGQDANGEAKLGNSY